ncbi:putative acetyltransferase SAR1027 [Folsomia candida]|uniref:putative acetyltransferase SAR1027 n=1 Tax=Folsomia candida TaxID=158441 RepID=UPI000B902D82|nr:putative acetyltransferase SAR1027 [Folsomia candida]
MGSSSIKIRELVKDAEPFLYQEFLLLRHHVLRLPIGMDLFAEDLTLENDHITFVAMSQNDVKGDAEGERVVGCVMLAPCRDDTESFQLRQMAVATDYQGQRLGAKLVEFAENYSKQVGKKKIILNGRKTAVPFYQKMNFKLVSEQEFIMSGIPHFAMEKIL